MQNASKAYKDDYLLIENLTDFIYRKIKKREPVNVQQLCDFTGLSQPTLYRRVSNAIQLPPKQLILKVQCEYAKHLLVNTNLSVVDIAYQCGFNSGNYFAKAFRRCAHYSPTDFRKKSKNED